MDVRNSKAQPVDDQRDSETMSPLCRDKCSVPTLHHDPQSVDCYDHLIELLGRLYTLRGCYCHAMSPGLLNFWDELVEAILQEAGDVEDGYE